MTSKILIITVLTVTLLPISIQSEMQTQKSSDQESYGITMSTYMDTSVNPCNDFYRYSCGNYFKVNKVKEGLKGGGIFSSIRSDIMEVMHDILTDESSNRTQDDNLFKKTRTMYQACLKANIFDYEKSDEYLKLIESLGGWPALNPNWNEDDFDWFETISKIKKYGVDIIFKETVQESAIGIEPDLFGLHSHGEGSIYRPYSRYFYVNKQLAYKIMTIYGVTPRAARKAFQEIIEFGKEVMKAETVSEVHRGKISRHTISSLDSFDRLTYDWKGYFTNLFGEEANDSTRVFVKSEDYIQYIPMAFRKKFLRGAANYIFLKLLFMLHDEFRFAKYSQRYCFLYIERYMKQFLSVFYMRSKYHRKSTKDEVLKMLSYIKNALSDTINSSEWMDEETKKSAQHKLNVMKFIFADDDSYSVDLNEIDRKFYQELKLNADNYHGNNLIIRSHEQKLNHRYFISTLDDVISDALLVPLNVNAYYGSINEVLLMPGILRMPFYNPELPMAYNFASIGRILGHEITHGFDYRGRNYDENGKKVNWWSAKSSDHFEKLAKCFVRQYNKYKVPEINRFVNGERTLAENIADSGGLRQAFMGYQKWLSDHPEQVDNENLSILNLTNTQLFFVSYGQTYCVQQLERTGYLSSLDDEHAPSKFRLIGSIQNFEKFGEEFNCRSGSPMNPWVKCILW